MIQSLNINKTIIDVVNVLIINILIQMRDMINQKKKND